MLEPEPSHISLMVRVIAKGLDPLGKIFAGLQMPSRMTIALVLALLEREVDHRPQHQRRRHRIALLQRICGGRQKPIMVPIQFIMARQDQLSGSAMGRPFYQKGEGLIEGRIAGDICQSTVLGLHVIEIGQALGESLEIFRTQAVFKDLPALALRISRRPKASNKSILTLCQSGQ